jgi:hypothetical protein
MSNATSGLLHLLGLIAGAQFGGKIQPCTTIQAGPSLLHQTGGRLWANVGNALIFDIVIQNVLAVAM